MVYDVFISYSRKDVDWASRLERDLKKRGISVFRDEERLRAGEKWDQQLQDAIADSMHLVVLWSPNARESDWVEEERIHFEADRKGSTERRQTVFVNLQGKYKAVGAFEQVDNVNQAGLYEAGAKALDQRDDVW